MYEFYMALGLFGWSPAATTAIRASHASCRPPPEEPQGHVKFVHACYARLLDICQQHHITTTTCFAAPGPGAAPACRDRGHLRSFARRGLYPGRWALPRRYIQR